MTELFSYRHPVSGAGARSRTFALQTDIGPAAAVGLEPSAIPETRVVDGSAKELSVTIQPFYTVKAEIPKNLELQLWFIDKQVVRVKPDGFPVTVKVPLPPLGESRGLDRKLYFLADIGKDLRPVAIGVSQVADLSNRLERLTRATSGQVTTIEEATARSRAILLRAATLQKPVVLPTVQKLPVPPTDLPYADLLSNAETMLDGKPFFTDEKHGQFWLSVPVPARDVVPCRVHSQSAGEGQTGSCRGGAARVGWG